MDLTVLIMAKTQKHEIYILKKRSKSYAIYLEQSPVPTFYIVNVGGGYLDGDRYRVNVNLEDKHK